MDENYIKGILSEELFGNRIIESVGDSKIVDFFYKNLLLEKLLDGEPISVPELRKLLRKKIVNFEFIKLDGEKRPAQGTTMMKYIPPKDHPKGIRPSSPKVATFFDLDKDAWRSVSRRSKEIVLKKDEKSDKPIIVVKDKAEVKVKPVEKVRTSKDPIKQGRTYKYTTNRGTKTYVEILRELPNGEFQVSSPLFRTTFAVNASRIGDKYTPGPEDTAAQTKPTPTPPKAPVSKVEPVEAKPQPKPAKPQPPAQEPEKTTVLLPTEVKEEKPGEVKQAPIDITPPSPQTLPGQSETPEELKK